MYFRLTNPGPFDSDISSSSSSDLDNISAVSELINNTFSFLHLNIQSIVSKIDMISAEYSCHDILSFTESWLNENTSTFNISPGLQITSWWDIECAVQVFFII
jgi:hypothetical protein